MSARLRVLVVGASVAGPTAAYWLARAGAEVTVIERFPVMRKGAQAVDVRACGVSVMRKMDGMEELVRQKYAGEEALTLVRSDGRSYGSLRATGNPDQQTLISEYEILRGDLAQILYYLTASHGRIKYVFNEQVKSLDRQGQTSGPIRVGFANGRQDETFDLVVAADGATSRTRALGLGCGIRDHVFPTGIWAAYFSTPRDLLDGRKMGMGYNAPGGRFLTLGPKPSGGSLITMLCRGSDEGFRRATEQDEVKEFIAEQYSNAGWISKQVVAEMRDAEDFYASEIVQVKLPRLQNGRFVVLGDAGYAVGPTGFGTSIALAGAYILAGELQKNPGNIEAGLQRYEDHLRPMIQEMQKIPPLVSVIATPQSAWAIWLRNNLFGLFTRSGIAELVLRLFGGGAFGSSDKFPLPEYEWRNK